MGSESPIRSVANWPVVSLAEVTTKIGSGATPTGGAEAYLPERETYAFIRSQNVLVRSFDSQGLAFVTDEQAGRLRGVSLQENDLLLNITGDGVTFGRACMVPPEILPACVNQHVAIVRARVDRAAPGYLLAFLTHPEVKPYIESFNAGGSRRAITKANIESFLLPLPPLPTQRAIARILGALDDKIDLNRRTNETLEAMARALFQSWFPSGTSRTQRVVSDLIREGLLVVGDGYRAKNTELGSTGLPFARAGDVLAGAVSTDTERLLPDRVPFAKEKVSRAGDVVFTSKGTVGRFAFIRANDPTFVFSPQLCFWRSADPGRLSPLFMYWWMKGPEFVDQLNRVKGQTDMADYVSLRDQKMMVVPVPGAAEQASFVQVVEPIDRMIGGLRTQSRTLAALRDTLLPKLLSGALSVAEAETTVGRAL